MTDRESIGALTRRNHLSTDKALVDRLAAEALDREYPAGGLWRMPDDLDTLARIVIAGWSRTGRAPSWSLAVRQLHRRWREGRLTGRYLEGGQR